MMRSLLVIHGPGKTRVDKPPAASQQPAKKTSPPRKQGPKTADARRRCLKLRESFFIGF
jgi:hypothetical protein